MLNPMVYLMICSTCSGNPHFWHPDKQILTDIIVLYGRSRNAVFTNMAVQCTSVLTLI